MLASAPPAPAPAGVTAAAVTPAAAAPGKPVTFTVWCANPDSISASLSGQAIGLAGQLAMQPTRTVGEFVLQARVPATIAPGRYVARVSCADGTSAPVAVQVTAGGLGLTATPVSTWLSVTGLALLGVGLGCGGLAVRRRSAGLALPARSGLVPQAPWNSLIRRSASVRPVANRYSRSSAFIASSSARGMATMSTLGPGVVVA